MLIVAEGWKPAPVILKFRSPALGRGELIHCCDLRRLRRHHRPLEETEIGDALLQLLDVSNDVDILNSKSTCDVNIACEKSPHVLHFLLSLQRWRHRHPSGWNCMPLLPPFQAIVFQREWLHC